MRQSVAELLLLLAFVDLRPDRAIASHPFGAAVDAVPARQTTHAVYASTSRTCIQISLIRFQGAFISHVLFCFQKLTINENCEAYTTIQLEVALYVNNASQQSKNS
jgi:hypothetical protein